MNVRWNSEYLMIKRFLQNKRVIELVNLEHEDLPQFDDYEWALLEYVSQLLAPLNDATQLIQSRDATIGAIIPLYHVITKKLMRLSGPSIVGKMAQRIRFG